VTSSLDFEQKTDSLVAFIRDIYGPEFIPLHRPVFAGNEKKYLIETIDSNFVSSVGAKVVEFENVIASYTGAKYGIATVNGTAALHMALIVSGVEPGDEVISQALTFVATCNAISYAGAKPVFIDVDRDTMGLSPAALRKWLDAHTKIENGACYNTSTGARIKACVPMHTFGLPVRIQELADICSEFNIALVEDTAESLGSFVGGTHTGNFGKIAAFSFNGNKVITTGGGGMLITNDEDVAKRATTAKVPHATEFVHDSIGYNYRMPNLNAALGCAQMEMLPQMLAIKAEVAKKYRDYAAENGWNCIAHPSGTIANDWLIALCLNSPEERQSFLARVNKAGVMTRPIWTLMNKLEMFKNCQRDSLENSEWLEARIVNIPSGVPDMDIERLSL